ncbi:uncharacterized protein LOC124811671 isoform X2 [Hydra vulgaris]|uniref:uncharacterized protein LOC124811671 isoform X2 n=1 Tax=Hydra vulgaris TaxID=6087 RepID=UPI0032EA0218
MATYSKSVLDALTENPAQLFVDFLRFLESTQPITVPSTSAIRVTSSAPSNYNYNYSMCSTSCCRIYTAYHSSFYICYLCYIFCGFYDSLDTTGQEGGRLAWHMSRPLCQLIHHLYML